MHRWNSVIGPEQETGTNLLLQVANKAKSTRGSELRRRMGCSCPDAQRASSHHSTQAEAEARAKEIVGNAGGGEVVIHGRNGRIRDSDTVQPGNDPNPPRDTKHGRVEGSSLPCCAIGREQQAEGRSCSWSRPDLERTTVGFGNLLCQVQAQPDAV